MNQPPLNPDGVQNAMDTLMAETDTDERATEWAHKVTTRVLEGYFAAALPEVTSFDPRELNRRGWTCGCEPGNYDTCDECQSACNELAGFLNRPEVKP